MVMFDVTSDGSCPFPDTAVLKVMTPQDSLLRVETQS
jgi:hypothetical protein